MCGSSSFTVCCTSNVIRAVCQVKVNTSPQANSKQASIRKPKYPHYCSEITADVFQRYQHDNGVKHAFLSLSERKCLWNATMTLLPYVSVCVCEAELWPTKGTVMQKTAQQWTLFPGMFFCLYGGHCAWWADWVINDAISVICSPGLSSLSSVFSFKAETTTGSLSTIMCDLKTLFTGRRISESEEQ